MSTRALQVPHAFEKRIDIAAMLNYVAVTFLPNLDSEERSG
ncbi:MAG: hypothetical protein EWM72_01800 [Nitrospira sp.]|nr:MAG: hypothetical protein EWM72_01800 [Nitrospira sp.]